MPKQRGPKQNFMSCYLIRECNVGNVAVDVTVKSMSDILLIGIIINLKDPY